VCTGNISSKLVIRSTRCGIEPGQVVELAAHDGDEHGAVGAEAHVSGHG
jgi:hypothetical protein